MFDSTSRYSKLEQHTLEREGQDPVKYVSRRFVPAPERLQKVAEAAVRSEDRPDLLSYRTLGDPLQFWRLADANRSMDPGELTEDPGATIVIPMPQP